MQMRVVKFNQLAFEEGKWTQTGVVDGIVNYSATGDGKLYIELPDGTSESAIYKQDTLVRVCCCAAHIRPAS